MEAIRLRGDQVLAGTKNIGAIFLNGLPAVLRQLRLRLLVSQ
jgi:hypothetical protein